MQYGFFVDPRIGPSRPPNSPPSHIAGAGDPHVLYTPLIRGLMQFRTTASLALLVALAGLAGCSGGSATAGAANFSCTGTDPNALCLSNCNLGCSSTGCLRTDIYQNEILILQFSDPVDPSTVDPTTIRLRTAAGEQPVGEFFVNGNQVEFVPTLLVSGGQTYFGFRPNEAYTLTIPGGKKEPITVRSTSGQPFLATYSCTLLPSLGIRDINGVPPSAHLITPTTAQVGSAPLNTLIQLEFNEMIDVTPFFSGSPVTFDVRRTRVDNGVRICDSNSEPVGLPGTPRVDFDPSRGVSVLTFTPAVDLPSNVCVEINVTSQVVDLAGHAADPQTFSFLTVELPLAEDRITEEFLDDQYLDRENSGGQWTGGVATFSVIGGDGRHGVFSPDLGTYLGALNGKDTYLFNTDNTTIPAANTLIGTPMSVSDGNYYFSSVFVPASVRLRFTGSNPPVFHSAGAIDVLGEIDIQGESLNPLSPTSATGQTGGAGGIFGGRGGRGGDKIPNGTAGAQPLNQGQNGESAHVLGGRAYATTAASTGGRGSTVFPASGLNSALIFAVGSVTYSPSASAGGGGGGLWAAGQDGRVVSNNHPDPVLLVPPRLDAMGPPAAGGTAVQFFPFPPASGSTRSALHFLVGGSGGGGAASNAALSINVAPSWASGQGGGGGGGALGLRAGDSLSLGGLARLLANGGTAANTANGGTSAPAPAGGGSGGTVLLQSGRVSDITGLINVNGGLGGSYNRTAGPAAPTGAQVQIAGGNASSGFIRLELPGTVTTALLPNTQPAATNDNVGTLTDSDDAASFRSTWYSTGLVFGPEFVRYEIHATVGTSNVIFSDDPNTSTVAAGPGAAIDLYLQAAQLDLGTLEVLQTRPWRKSVITTQNQVGIASDGLNAFRFVIIQDRTLATNVTIDKFVVVYRH